MLLYDTCNCRSAHARHVLSINRSFNYQPVPHVYLGTERAITACAIDCVANAARFGQRSIDLHGSSSSGTPALHGSQPTVCHYIRLHAQNNFVKEKHCTTWRNLVPLATRRKSVSPDVVKETRCQLLWLDVSSAF